MAPFTGDCVWPGENFTIDDDPPARPRTDNDPEDNIGISAGAVRRLRERKTICVVGHAHWPCQRSCQVFVKRSPDQPGGIRILNQTGRRRDGPRDTDADRAPLADALFHSMYEIGDRLHRRIVIPVRCRDSCSVALVAIRQQRDGLDFCPADVDTDSQIPPISMWRWDIAVVHQKP